MFRRISFLATSDVSKTLVVISECLMHKSSPLWGKCNNFILQVDFVQIVRLLVGSGDKFLFQLMTEGSKFTDVNSMYDLMHYHIPLLYCSWFQFHWIKMDKDGLSAVKVPRTLSKNTATLRLFSSVSILL